MNVTPTHKPTKNGSTSALSHIRVLDMSRVLAGPWATQLLADLGADVVKVERPGTGDDTRAWGPPWLEGDDEKTRVAAYYLCANRNKRSITVDISRPEGQDLIRQLACESDVVVENFKFGGLKRLGLDYETMAALNPRLVYCSITGFGHTGPYAQRAGYDFLVQGLGGLMSVTGRPDDEPGGGPLKVGVALTDILTGLYAANAIQAALSVRDKTGHGQHIDMALLDVQVACLANQAMNYLATGQTPQLLGNAHPNIVPYQDFPTSDGSILLAIGNDGQFARFCEEANCSYLASDERYATNSMRVRHRSRLIPILKNITRSRTTSDWIRSLSVKSVPCGPINDLSQTFDDPQVRARSMSTTINYPGVGSIPMVSNPIRFSETPIKYDLPPPPLGAHTVEVLEQWLSLSRTSIQALSNKGVI